MKLLIIITILSITGLFLYKNSSADKLTHPPNHTVMGLDYRLPASDLVAGKIKTMTLREKIAQMVVANIIPDKLDINSEAFKKYVELCEKTKVGGFIFFKGSSTEYVTLSNKLQSHSETPLLIGADFERGTKMRVTDGALFPNNMAIGAANNPDLAYKMGLEIARETRLIGIHQNYSPVCDVNNNPKNPIINVRSFGENPSLVSRMSESMIKGLQDGNVIATAKHFPGHGDTDIDSHSDLPVLNFTMDRLNTLELVPFQNAINKNVMSVMIAHLAFPELESAEHVPASLSKNIVQGLLIDKMGFNGLVVTDALNMQGITKYFDNSQVAVMCVEAGIDLILMPLDPVGTVDAIEQAVTSGRISEERINRSVEKIMKAKEWLGLFNNKMVAEADVWKSMNTPNAQQIAQQIADESITLVKDEKSVLPLDPVKKTALIVISEGGESDNVAYLGLHAGEYLKNYDFIKSNELDIKSLGNYENVIIAVYAKVRYGTGKISISPENVSLIQNINSTNPNAVVLALGSPYLLKEFPLVNSYICAYGDADVSILASLKCIIGTIPFKGKLPVSVTENYKYGHGITK